jgi:hypothetical protein
MKVKHLFLIVTSFLCISSVATAGVLDPCESTAYVVPTGGTFSTCPFGDFQTLGGNGITVYIEAKDNTGAPLAAAPASDFWFVDCDALECLFLCPFSANADSATNLNGKTTITGSIRGGGCVSGLAVVAQSLVIKAGNCVDDLCLDISVHTLDITGQTCPDPGSGITGNGLVDLGDFSFFAPANGSNPGDGNYEECLDYVPPTTINLSDFSFFGQHLGHVCP